jgi:hypothetical protein
MHYRLSSPTCLPEKKAIQSGRAVGRFVGRLSAAARGTTAGGPGTNRANQTFESEGYSMGLKDAFDKAAEAVKHGAEEVADAVKHGVEDVKERVSEAGHHTAAEGEQVKRDVAGDTLTPGETASSVLNQGKENLAAGVDSVKRDL